MLLYQIEDKNMFINLEEIVAIIEDEELDVFTFTMSCGQSVDIEKEEALALVKVLGYHNKQNVMSEIHRPEITD